MNQTVDNQGRVGAIRQQALRMEKLGEAERHGKREDKSGPSRQVRDADPLVIGTLDLTEARAAHMRGVKTQGKTACLHCVVQFPTKLIDGNDEQQQKMMLAHAARFVNRFHGGDAVFAARLDRDEKGQHVVDVFAMPKYDFHYKDGRTQKKASVSKFAKQAARERFGKDNPRAQGSALQDAWFEYMRDEVGIDVRRPSRKKKTVKDRLEPEAYGLEQDRKRFESEKQAFNAEARKRALALKAREAKLSRDLEAAKASIRKDQREAALALAVAQRVAESRGDQSAANEVRVHRNKLKRDERSR
jgi:hypothetical protein